MLKENSKIKIVWKGYYHEMSKSKENEIKDSFSKTHGIPKNQIELEKIYLKKTENKERASKAVLDSLLNPEKLKQAYKDYLKENFPEIDIQDFLGIDAEVTSKFQNVKDVNNLQERKYKFLWIKAKNVFSYGEFYRDYTSKTGVTSVYSTPANQGGKTALSRMPSFLLFGNKIKYGRKSAITFTDVFNIFADSSEAFIEGEIQIQNDVYFLRRTLKKSKSGKISHEYSIYKYDPSGEYVDFLKRNAINLNIKDAQVTRKKFEDTIGSYEDYVFSSYYESQNIEKWLETTETERYRLFCEYLGLGILEEKYQIAKEMYNTHVKTSLMSKFNMNDLIDEVTESKAEIRSLEIEEQDTISAIEELKKALTHYTDLTQKFHANKKPIDKRVENLDLQSVERKISSLKNTKEQSEQELLDLNKKRHVFKDDKVDTIDKNTLNEEIKRLTKEISEASNQTPLNLTKKLQSAKEKVFEVKENEEMVKRINSASDEYQKLQSEYQFTQSQIKALAIELEEVPNEMICSKCGNVEGGEKKRLEIENKSSALQISLEDIKNKGIAAKKEVDRISSENREFISKEKQKISDEIKLLEKEISENTKKYIEEKNQEISKIRVLTDKFESYERVKTSIEKIINSLEINKRDIQVQNDLINLHKENLDSIEFNKLVDVDLFKTQESINEINRDFNDYSKELSDFGKSKSILEYKIHENNKMINEIKQEYLRDKNLKTYLQVHGDEGLSKHIILTILPQMNADLAELLADIADFELLIDFDSKGIRFFYEREGKRFNLYQGSGYEKTISCLALHYVNIRMTTLPISNNLILDEVFGGFSREKMESLKKLLSKLGEVFDTIDVITHTLNDEVKSIADNLLKIEKVNNLSKILS